ncbi:MAG: peroxide stress protein YaaA [Gammaproteobacteria bacterium]
MLIVISPAKTLDFESPLTLRKHSEPAFGDDTATLVGLMQRKKPAALKQLMGISDTLARLNHERFQESAAGTAPTRQAVMAFMGDVYTGLDAASLDRRDLDWAQKHLRILSGLYGLLRPLDLIEPYRLEMGTRLKTPRGGSLYEFWGERPARALNEQAGALRTRWLVNLASNEYFGAIDRDVLEPTVVTPVFKERKGSGYRVLSFFAKKARGMMARYIIEQRLRKPEGMRDFAVAGYRYDEALSGPTEYVFTRETA